MAAPINGRINDWPVWIMTDWMIGYTTGLLDCCPYGQSDVVPDEIWQACDRIFNACKGLGPEAALQKAKELGFVPDQNIPDFRPMTADDRIYGGIVMFREGDPVRVVAGPFTSFNGVVEEVDEARSRLEVAVLIFGNVTSVVLEFGQVEKM